MKRLFSILAITCLMAVGTVNANATTTLASATTTVTNVAQSETADAEDLGFHQELKKRFIEGGPGFMGIVLLCLILGLAIAIERIITLNLSTTNTAKLTQSVEDATKSQISDTLIQQTATQIFLPNLKATEVYKTAFMLSQREYMLIKTTDPGSRYFLIKQGVNAVIAKVNLAGMDNVINVLSGRADTVVLLDQLIEKHGSDPKKWLPVFYEEVKALG